MRGNRNAFASCKSRSIYGSVPVPDNFVRNGISSERGKTLGTGYRVCSSREFRPFEGNLAKCQGRGVIRRNRGDRQATIWHPITALCPLAAAIKGGEGNRRSVAEGGRVRRRVRGICSPSIFRARKWAVNDWWWAECWAFWRKHLFLAGVTPRAAPGHLRNAFWRGPRTSKRVPPGTPSRPPATTRNVKTLGIELKTNV